MKTAVLFRKGTKLMRSLFTICNQCSLPVVRVPRISNFSMVFVILEHTVRFLCYVAAKTIVFLPWPIGAMPLRVSEFHFPTSIFQFPFSIFRFPTSDFHFHFPTSKVDLAVFTGSTRTSRHLQAGWPTDRA